MEMNGHMNYLDVIIPNNNLPKTSVPDGKYQKIYQKLLTGRKIRYIIYEHELSDETKCGYILTEM